MSARVTPFLLLAILFGCLSLSANCEGGYEERLPPPDDGRRWEVAGAAGEQMMTVRRSSSRKMLVDAVAGACVRSTCEGSPCFCCQTVPTTPCFLVLDACLRVCSGPLL